MHWSEGARGSLFSHMHCLSCAGVSAHIWPLTDEWLYYTWPLPSFLRGLWHVSVITITHTFKLGISHTAPLSTAISDTRASHHVTQDIVSLVPLVPDTIHHPFAGCADFFMSYRQQNHACVQAEISTQTKLYMIFVGKVNRAQAQRSADSTGQLLQKQ